MSILTLTIHGGTAPRALPPAPFAPVQIEIAGATIAAVTPGARPSAPVELDATGCTVLPGLVDVHVHGAVGRDTMDADPAALAAMAAFFARHGVTGFLATTMTAGPAETLAAVQAAAAYGRATGPQPGARLLGIHLEGPFLSPRFPGAQLPEQIRPPDLDEFAALADAGPVRMITLAPEQPGAHDLIRAARARGLVVVAGHTAASYDECERAISLGVSQATHTYNAMTGLHHRQPGTLGSVLSNDAMDAQLIADNVHVHPAAMKVLARCKGALRTVLITDAMRAVGLQPGHYELGGQPVIVQDGQCRLADGTLAGSVLTLEVGLANFLAAAGWTLAEGWPAAGYTAARALGLSDELGQVAPGFRADLVLLDADLAVVATVVDGRVVYLRDAERLRGDVRDDHPARTGPA